MAQFEVVGARPDGAEWRPASGGPDPPLPRRSARPRAWRFSRASTRSSTRCASAPRSRGGRLGPGRPRGLAGELAPDLAGALPAPRRRGSTTALIAELVPQAPRTGRRRDRPPARGRPRGGARRPRRGAAGPARGPAHDGQHGRLRAGRRRRRRRRRPDHRRATTPGTPTPCAAPPACTTRCRWPRSRRCRRGDRPLVAIDPEGEDLRPGGLPPRAILAFGTERHGLSDELLERADARLGIPMRDGRLQPQPRDLGRRRALLARRFEPRPRPPRIPAQWELPNSHPTEQESGAGASSHSPPARRRCCCSASAVASAPRRPATRQRLEDRDHQPLRLHADAAARRRRGRVSSSPTPPSQAHGDPQGQLRHRQDQAGQRGLRSLHSAGHLRLPLHDPPGNARQDHRRLRSAPAEVGLRRAI